MVGVAVGLLVVSGALSLFARNIVGSRHLLTETRLNQDLRAATDVIARDLRRAGYWGNAIQGTIAIGAGSVTAQNPYAALSGSTENGFTYGFSRDNVENNVLDSAEQFGFRLNSGVLQMQTASGVWQDLTDGKTLSVSAFTVTPTVTTLSLGSLCPKNCGAGTPNCPTTTVRSFAIAITGSAVSDNTIVRSMNSTVRVRNDQLAGQCPA